MLAAAAGVTLPTKRYLLCSPAGKVPLDALCDLAGPKSELYGNQPSLALKALTVPEPLTPVFHCCQS